MSGGERKLKMLKVVVFDGGYGGEFFADKLEEELTTVEVIRVIDWRNADQILASARKARKIAENALRSYIGGVDLIIFANHLLTATSLKYFQRKYKNQKFLGFDLKRPDSFIRRDVLILTTKAVTRTISYYSYLFHVRRKIRTLTLDSWPTKIDDGELNLEEIKTTITKPIAKDNFRPQEIILACSQFEDIKGDLKTVLGQNIKIYDSYEETLRRVYKALKIRGGNGKKD
ncbi:MAG: hypothetical protein Q4F56_01155 [Candidatus Saccharibacteria bacterium]|nr:hypothetical protein [Candidatus Saccharibacteria bacterium]